VIGHGADMTVRTPGRHDQRVGDGALAFQVDEDNVLRLIVVQALQDQFSQGDNLRLGIGRSAGNRGFVRSRRRVRAQRGRSFVASLGET
jgi:hypothetical protein